MTPCQGRLRLAKPRLFTQDCLPHQNLCSLPQPSERNPHLFNFIHTCL